MVTLNDRSSQEPSVAVVIKKLFFGSRKFPANAVVVDELQAEAAESPSTYSMKQ
jgi:hypothetical protein